MTPPIRNFSLGSSHPGIGEAEIAPAEGRLSVLLRASAEQNQASRRSQAEAVDQFLVVPTLRYRPTTVALFQGYSDEQMESFVPVLLTQARGGHRLSYFNLLQLHYGMLDRTQPARIPGLSQRAAAIALEYVEFLRAHPEISDDEKLRSLYAGARVLHTYLAHLLNPPRPLPDFPEREATLNLLFTTLDSLDAELQGYHDALRTRGFPDLAEYEGVSRMIAFRRRLRQGSEAERREAALSLAEELTRHPPPASDDGWQARAERTILEMPNPFAQLRSFDRPSAAEERAASLNALALETLEVAAAALDCANEENETTLQARYRDLGLVLSVSILRHPERTLEEHLHRLEATTNQTEFVEEIRRAQVANPALASALSEALRGREAGGLVAAARGAAIHVRHLQSGLGSAILPTILEENREHHPLRNVAEALARLPLLATQLHLPQAGAVDPVIQRQQAMELLRRGDRGLREVGAFQAQHPELSVSLLRRDLEGGSELDGFASATLARLAGTLERGRDHELAALDAAFTALSRETELAPGLSLSETSRSQARALRQRINSPAARATRVVSHLTSSYSLLGLAAGILATEFLPTLLIARAGLSGSLALGRVPLVRAGALSWQGSALTGLGTGLGMSLIGSSLHQWERHHLGLATHWGRDFGSSLLLNAATFGLTLPVSRLLNRALTLRFDGTTPLAPLSAGRGLLLHGANVAVGGTTAFGLGYLGRGLSSGQWRTSPEEVAENFGSILLWEAGAAGVRGLRRRRGYAAELGPYRMAEVERLTGRILERHGGLAERRAAIENHLAGEEARHPGWIGRFGSLLERGSYVPILEGQGRSERLLLVPQSSLPAPAAPPAASLPVIVVVGETSRPALAEGSESSERESVAPPPPDTETADAPPPRPRSLPPLELAESPHYLAVEADAAYGEPAGLIHLGSGETRGGQLTWVLGRQHFHFLSPQARRVLSRAQLEIRRGENGIFSIRSLSVPPVGRWADGHGAFYRSDPQAPWQRVPADTYLLINGTETIALGNIVGNGTRSHRGEIGNNGEPILLSFRHHPSPTVLESLRVDTMISPLSHPLQVSLASGQHQRFNGLTLLRPGEGSTFHIGGPGSVEIEITRSLGPQAHVAQRTNAGMNPAIGEIGESTRIVFLENGGRQEFHLSLDDPDRPAAHLPEVGIEYHGQSRSFRFRASEPEVVFGKNFQPDFFNARYISRRHFNLRVVTHEGQPRYLLTADSQFGIRLGDRLLRTNESALLYSGTHELGFSMAADSQQAFDGPFQLHLPPIEGVFPEWKTGPLLAGHDRNIPPLPPPPPAPPPSAPPPPAAATPSGPWAALREFWRRYFNR